VRRCQGTIRWDVISSGEGRRGGGGESACVALLKKDMGFALGAVRKIRHESAVRHGRQVRVIDKEAAK